jgi:hypothetical protein
MENVKVKCRVVMKLSGWNRRSLEKPVIDWENQMFLKRFK